jgi:hypothetical protein
MRRSNRDIKDGERAAQLIREYFKNPRWIKRTIKQKDNDDR